MPSDGNYNVSPASGPSPVSGPVTGSAYVIQEGNYGTTGTLGPYVPDSTTEWISPDPTGTSAIEPMGWYDYRTTFNVPVGLNPMTVVLTGDWAVDNEGQIFVNGLTGQQQFRRDDYHHQGRII